MRNIVNDVLFFIFVLVVLTVRPAQAAEWSVNIGGTAFKSVPNNTWYNNSGKHELTLTSPSIGFGVATTLDDGWTYGAELTYFGHVASDAWINNLDEDEQKYHGCNPTTGCLPMQHWQGRGSVSGLTLMAKTPQWHGLRLGVGVTTIFSTWHMDITGNDDFPNPYVFRSDRKPRTDFALSAEYQIDQHWAVRVLEFVSQNRETGRINYKNDPEHDEYVPSITRGYSTNLSINYTF